MYLYRHTTGQTSMIRRFNGIYDKNSSADKIDQIRNLIKFSIFMKSHFNIYENLLKKLDELTVQTPSQNACATLHLF